MAWAGELGLIRGEQDMDGLPLEVGDCGGVGFYPFFGGAYTPYWESRVAGEVRGLTFHSKRAHLVRAILEGIGFRVAEVLNLSGSEGDVFLDGGLIRNKFLPQFLADVIGRKLTGCEESTMLGVVRAVFEAAGRPATGTVTKIW